MRYSKLLAVSCSALLLALSACATAPMGPRVLALPAKGKPFEQFQYEQSGCKQYASDQIAGQVDEANRHGLIAGLAGTALGAGLGAAIGGGHGAAIGAAGGAVAGTAVGANSSSHEQRGIQGQYDDAYIQCMVAKGNKIQQPQQRVIERTVVVAPPPPPPATTVIYEDGPPPY